jgi:hypothetical protein
MQDIFSQMLRFIGQGVRNAGCLAMGCLLTGLMLLCAVFAIGYSLFITLTSR